MRVYSYYLFSLYGFERQLIFPNSRHVDQKSSKRHIEQKKNQLTFIFGFWENADIAETEVYFTLEVLAELIFLPTETDLKPILSLLQ